MDLHLQTFSYTGLSPTPFLTLLWKSHGCFIDHVFPLGLYLIVILISMQPRYEINLGTKKPNLNGIGILMYGTSLCSVGFWMSLQRKVLLSVHVSSSLKEHIYSVGSCCTTISLMFIFTFLLHCYSWKKPSRRYELIWHHLYHMKGYCVWELYPV